MTTMGDYIRAERERQGLTQKQVAEIAGTSKEYLAQIEGGKPKVPNAGLRRGIAKALGVRHVDLLIAAGELTDEEAPKGGSSAPDFPDEIRPAIVAGLKQMSFGNDNQMIRAVYRFVEPWVPDELRGEIDYLEESQ